MKSLKQPTSIRWQNDKMDFVREKEGLDTAQKVVSFLLEKYYWEHKSVYEKNIAPISPQVRGKSENKIKDDPYEEYIREINNAQGILSIKMTLSESNSDKALTSTQKEKIKQYGIQKSQELDV